MNTNTGNNMDRI